MHFRVLNPTKIAAGDPTPPHSIPLDRARCAMSNSSNNHHHHGSSAGRHHNKDMPNHRANNHIPHDPPNSGVNDGNSNRTAVADVIASCSFTADDLASSGGVGGAAFQRDPPLLIDLDPNGGGDVTRPISFSAMLKSGVAPTNEPNVARERIDEATGGQQQQQLEQRHDDDMKNNFPALTDSLGKNWPAAAGPWAEVLNNGTSSAAAVDADADRVNTMGRSKGRGGSARNKSANPFSHLNKPFADNSAPPTYPEAVGFGRGNQRANKECEYLELWMWGGNSYN